MAPRGAREGGAREMQAAGGRPRAQIRRVVGLHALFSSAPAARLHRLWQWDQHTGRGA